MHTRLFVIFALVLTFAVGANMAGAAGGDAAKGKKLAKGCSCHKKKHPLNGMAEAEFIQKMHDYRDGKGTHKPMIRIAKKYDDQQISDLAAYYHGL